MAYYNFTSEIKTIITCFGATKVWQEKNHEGRINTWIEYANEYGFTTQEKVGQMQLAEYCK